MQFVYLPYQDNMAQVFLPEIYGIKTLFNQLNTAYYCIGFS